MPAHVFVTSADLTRLACDDWLLPTDQGLHVREYFVKHLRERAPKRSGRVLDVAPPDGWSDNGVRAIRTQTVAAR